MTRDSASILRRERPRRHKPDARHEHDQAPAKPPDLPTKAPITRVQDPTTTRLDVDRRCSIAMNPRLSPATPWSGQVDHGEPGFGRLYGRSSLPHGSTTTLCVATRQREGLSAFTWIQRTTPPHRYASPVSGRPSSVFTMVTVAVDRYTAMACRAGNV